MFIEKRYPCVSAGIHIEIKYGQTRRGESYCGTIEQGIEYRKNEGL